MKQRMRIFKTSEFIRILKNNGYTKRKKGKGDHDLFINDANRVISIPVGDKTINPCITRRLINENNLIVD